MGDQIDMKWETRSTSKFEVVLKQTCAPKLMMRWYKNRRRHNTVTKTTCDRIYFLILSNSTSNSIGKNNIDGSWVMHDGDNMQSSCGNRSDDTCIIVKQGFLITGQ